MPIAPLPRNYSCPACHCSKAVMPRSDTLLRTIDHFDACPVCRHKPLETQAASATRATITGLAEQIKRLLRLAVN